MYINHLNYVLSLLDIWNNINISIDFFFLAFIGREVQLTNGIVIGAGCRITCPEVIPENTVIFGKQCHRRIQGDKPPVKKSSFSIDFKIIYILQFYYIINSFRLELNLKS